MVQEVKTVKMEGAAVIRARHECGSSAGWPQVPAKNPRGLRTRGSGSSYSHGSWRIRVTILDFRRYLQVPAGHPLPAHAQQLHRIDIFIKIKYFSILQIWCFAMAISFSSKSRDIVRSSTKSFVYLLSLLSTSKHSLTT